MQPGIAVLVYTVTCACPMAAAQVAPVHHLSVATEAGLAATFTGPTDHAPARLQFSKTGPEPRFVGFRGVPTVPPAGARTLQVRFRLTGEGIDALRAAALLSEAGGARWLKLGAPTRPSADEQLVVLSMASLKPAPFSESVATDPDLGGVSQVWVGVVLTGQAHGVFELVDATFSDARPLAVAPLIITDNAPGVWGLFSDPAARATVSTPNEGPDGRNCMKLQFHFPGGRHMFANPHVSLPLVDLEGYSALRLRYRATLPAGIGGLLVMLGEAKGAIYIADPPPSPSAEWVTLTVPFAELKLGAWTRDDNDRLDLDGLTTLYIGVHGTALGDGGPGTVWATDIEFIP